MSKEKKAYPEDFKTMFGVTTMGLSQAIANSLITGFLMLYITDYAGLYTGIAGKAAQVAAFMLLLGRLWDGINDPILGFFMDRSRRTKWGKFKPFMFWGTVASAVLIIALFNIPASLPDVAKVALIYVLYLTFDAAFTLLPMNPLVQSLTKDSAVRTKLLVIPRIVLMLFSVLMSFFLAIAIALGPDGVTPNIGLAVGLFMVPATVLSLIGVALIKEGTNNADEEQVKPRDILAMVKVNKPLLITLLASLFSGFVGSFLFASVIYYIKYSFGVENLSTHSMIWGLTILSGMLLGAVLSQFIQKHVTPGIGFLVSGFVGVSPLVALWVINLAGPISNPFVFYPLLFITMLGGGMSYVPGMLLNMECMDYNKYKMGKSMEGMINALGQFVGKFQVAIASAITGWVLFAVGYDAELYKDATAIPLSLFKGLGLVLFAIPALCSFLSMIAISFYPLLRKSKRDVIYAEMKSPAIEKVVGE